MVRDGKSGHGAAAGWLATLLFLVVLLNYVDRGAIALAAPLLKPELGLSATGFGIAVSAFFWIYAPAQFAVGWAVDRFGVARLLGFGVALWAVATMATSLVGGLATLVVLRLLLGLGEAFTFPAAAKVIAGHVPDERRGMANGAIGMGISFGPAVGTLAGGLIVAGLGWRPMFALFGAVTLLWLWPWAKAARGLAPTERRAAPGLGTLLRLRATWAMGLAHFSATWGHYFVLAWFPLYLVQQRGLSLSAMTAILTAGLAAQGAAAFAMGWHSDARVRAGADEGQYRRWAMIACQVAIAIGIVGLMRAEGQGAVLGWMLWLGVAAAGSTVHNYAVAQMFAGPRAAGGFVGSMNGIGNMSGIVGPIVTGMIVDWTGRFDAAFVLTAIIAGAGALLWAVAVPAIGRVGALRDD